MFTFKTHIHKDGDKLVTIDTENDSMEMSVEKMTISDITKIEKMLQQNINTVCNVLRTEKNTATRAETISSGQMDNTCEKPVNDSAFQMPIGSARFRKIYAVADWLNG